VPKIPDEFSVSRARVQPLTGVPTLQSRTGGETAVAQAKTNLGSAIAEIGYREGVRIDDTRAEDAINKAKQAANDLAAGEKGFGQIKGEGITTGKVREDYSKLYDDNISEIEKGLSNARQRNLFRSRIAPVTGTFRSKLDSHIIEQTNKYQEDTAKATVVLESEEAARNWKSPDAVAASAARIDYTISGQAERNGWSPEVEKAAKQEALSNLHAGVISASVTNDPAYAKAYYDANKDDINSATRIRVERVLEEHNNRAEAQQGTDTIMLENLSQTEALKKARDQYKDNPKVRDDVVSRIKARYGEQDAMRKDMIDEAWLLIGKGTSTVDLPPELKDQIPGNTLVSMQAAERKLREGEQPVHNAQKWYEFNQKINKAIAGDKQAKQELVNMDIHKELFFDLDQTHFDQAIKAQQAFIKNDASALTKAKSAAGVVVTNKTAADLYLNKLFGEKKTSGRSESDNEFANQFYQLLQTEMEQWSIENDGKKVPATERDRILKELSQTVVEEGTLWDTTRDLSDIPTEELNTIAADLREAGLDVNGRSLIIEYLARKKAGVIK